MNQVKRVPCEGLEEELTKFIQSKCLIPGGLGLWEVYFRKICHAWGRIDGIIKPQHIIFAADNGCNMEGYVGYNYEVTQKQSRNMVLGHTAATHFCDFNNIPYEVVDVGIASEDGIGINRKVAKGTRNIMHHAAMTPEEFDFVFAAGKERVQYYVNQGINLISFGEMGLGNTTTSAAVLSALTGRPVEDTVGPGSWPDKEDLMKRKRNVVQQALDFHKDNLQSVESILIHLGGFDMVALAGAMVACGELKIPFVIDGFISAVATACAVRIDERVAHVAIPSHLSREKGMLIALEEICISAEDVPIHGHMAMGEGTGAILMVQLLKTNQYMFVNVGTFAEMMQL